MKLISFYKSYDKYKLHGVVRSSFLQSRPIHKEIREKLEEIKTLRTEGRAAKGENQWNDKWRAGVTALSTAFKKINELQSFLDDSFEKEKFRIIRTWKLVATGSIAAAILIATLMVWRLF